MLRELEERQNTCIVEKIIMAHNKYENFQKRIQINLKYLQCYSIVVFMDEILELSETSSAAGTSLNMLKKLCS